MWRAKVLAAALAAVILAPSCSRAPRTPIRIGINPWPGYEFLFLAKEKGLLEVPVDFIEYSSLGDARRAYERGQIDGLMCTLVEVLLARQQSQRLPQPFLVTDFSNGADVILSHPSITGIGGLRGKRVAAESASLGVFVLARALEKSGLSLADVTVVPMDQSGMEQALNKGNVAAVVTYPPVSVNLMRPRQYLELFNSAQIPGEVVDVVALDAAVLAARPGDAVRILQSWDQALAYARDHPEESYRIMARRERVSAAEFRESLQGVRLLSTAQQRDYFLPGGKLEAALAATALVLHATGQLQDPWSVSAGIVATGPIRTLTGR